MIYTISEKMGGVNWILPVTSRGIAPTIFNSIYLLFRCDGECSSHYSRKDCECC